MTYPSKSWSMGFDFDGNLQNFIIVKLCFIGFL